MPSGLTLIEFLEQHVATKEEFRRYLAVKHESLTYDLHTLFHEEQALAVASPEIQERYSLEKQLGERIREMILAGGWSISARWCNGGPFKELHKREFESGSIDICNNFVGALFAGKPHNGYRDIQIEPDELALLSWRTQEGRRDIDRAIKTWFTDYSHKKGKPITCNSAYELCVRDLVPKIPRSAIAESRFRKLFSKNFPPDLKFRGAPKK